MKQKIKEIRRRTVRRVQVRSRVRKRSEKITRMTRKNSKIFY